jgi:hypothetical protein
MIIHARSHSMIYGEVRPKGNFRYVNIGDPQFLGGGALPGPRIFATNLSERDRHGA